MYLALITFASITRHAVRVPSFGRKPCCQSGIKWLYLVIRIHAIRDRWTLHTGAGTPSGLSFPFALGIQTLVSANSLLRVLAMFIAPKSQLITSFRGSSLSYLWNELASPIKLNITDLDIIT